MPTEHSDLTEIVARGDRRMKRLSVAVVMACLLSVTIPGGAVHAAPKSASLAPVIKAIKKQFAKKSSVRFSVKRRGGPASFTWDMKASGAYRFRASGVYAADTTEITQRGRRTSSASDDSAAEYMTSVPFGAMTGARILPHGKRRSTRQTL